MAGLSGHHHRHAGRHRHHGAARSGLPRRAVGGAGNRRAGCGDDRAVLLRLPLPVRQSDQGAAAQRRDGRDRLPAAHRGHAGHPRRLRVPVLAGACLHHPAADSARPHAAAVLLCAAVLPDLQAAGGRGAVGRRPPREPAQQSQALSLMHVGGDGRRRNGPWPEYRGPLDRTRDAATLVPCARDVVVRIRIRPAARWRSRLEP